MPNITAFLCLGEGSVHQLLPEGTIAVCKPQHAEGRQNQIFLNDADFGRRNLLPAHIPEAHLGDGIVGAAFAIVEVLLTAQIGSPGFQAVHILLLKLFPHGFPLFRRIMLGKHLLHLFLARFGVHHVAIPVDGQVLLSHDDPPLLRMKFLGSVKHGQLQQSVASGQFHRFKPVRQIMQHILPQLTFLWQGMQGLICFPAAAKYLGT